MAHTNSILCVLNTQAVLYESFNLKVCVKSSSVADGGGCSHFVFKAAVDIQSFNSILLLKFGSNLINMEMCC